MDAVDNLLDAREWFLTHSSGTLLCTTIAGHSQECRSYPAAASFFSRYVSGPELYDLAEEPLEGLMDPDNRRTRQFKAPTGFMEHSDEAVGQMLNNGWKPMHVYTKTNGGIPFPGVPITDVKVAEIRQDAPAELPDDQDEIVIRQPVGRR